ncbi:hypothetical protein [Candidatus Nitronereus thalassa]|uniref:DUF4760 domain-containing protein n=1 Tax=Candidatus Nitronereus thalassa TaxID=3020898 RepID=A0ABU3KDI7_9BACT|nr:hypothetical protein [Candidatus Nitronereus thalassa]MDT7044303.1 hypothetical protein [Candidatus Nitronereus thalassa]
MQEVLDLWVRIAPSFTPLFILLSALIGYGASQWVTRKQVERERKDRDRMKSTTLHLLRDEICKRWETFIKPDLETLINENSNNYSYCVKRFSEKEISPHDLFVLEKIANTFKDYFILYDNALLSDIVHAHVLMLDLVDFKNLVNRKISTLEAGNKRLEICQNNEQAQASFGDKDFAIIESIYTKLIGKFRSISNKLELVKKKLPESSST